MLGIVAYDTASAVLPIFLRPTPALTDDSDESCQGARYEAISPGREAVVDNVNNRILC